MVYMFDQLRISIFTGFWVLMGGPNFLTVNIEEDIVDLVVNILCFGVF